MSARSGSADDPPDAIVAAALADAERRGIGPICIFFGAVIEAAAIHRWLADPRIASVGSKPDTDDRSADDLTDDPRVGRYWESGAWQLPACSNHVYFTGPWRRFSVEMLREAARRGVSSLRVRVGGSWVAIPLDTIHSVRNRAIPVLVAARRGFGKARSIWWSGRSAAARSLLAARPQAIDVAIRIAGPAGFEGDPLQRAFSTMMEGVTPSTDAVPRRVVHVCGNLQPGGAERQLVYALSALSRRDLESVRLLCHYLTRGSARRQDFYLPAIEAAGINAREVRRRTTSTDLASMPERLRRIARVLPPALAADISNLYWEFMEIKPQIVHAWLDWDNVRAGLAAVLAGVPKVILSGRNLNPSHFALYQTYMDPAYGALAQVPTVALINNSRAGADDYADWIGIPRSRIDVVRNAVDFGDQGRLTAEAARALRTSLGIPANAFVVGGVFRLEEEKRPLLWVDTAARVAEQVDAWFVLFGHGHLQDQVQRRARQAGLENRLILAGVTDQILPAMSIMDVLLLTSRGEGLPNVLLEAQWVGTPVVATDVGGTSEAIDPGVTGWAVQSNRPEALAERITWLFAHPEVRADVLRLGPAFVRENFGVDGLIANLLRIYEIE